MAGKFFGWLALIAVVFGFHCMDDRLTGGGTDTETALVAGVITVEGTAVEGAKVSIDSKSYWTVYTGSDGKFEIDDVDYGTHTIKAEWKNGGSTYRYEKSFTVKSATYNFGTLALVKAIAKR